MIMLSQSFIGDSNSGPARKIDAEWIASRRDAVKFYLWKKWHLGESDIEDVLQEIMVAAIKSFPNYQGLNNAEPETYLIGIAKNVVQTHFRRVERNERHRAPMEIAECIGVVFKDPTEIEELARLFKEKMSKLPPNYVQVLELIFYQDYREQEAAEKLGISVDKLYSLKSDALKRLRKLCKKDPRFKP